MIKKLRGVVFGLLIIFLIGCVSEQKVDNKGIVVKNDSVIGNQTKVVIENKSDKCEAGWKCLGKWKKSYLGADCQWSQESECRLGCVAGNCNVGKVCTAGFKCIDKNKMGYQTGSCAWIKTSKCPGGCLNGACLPEPEKNETTNTTVEVVKKSSAIDDTAVEEKPKETIHVTKLTETTNLTFNKKQYIIQIYNFEGDRVKIKVNNVKGDWLVEGQSYNYNGELTLTLKEILYQSYAGGKQQIGYSVK